MTTENLKIIGVSIRTTNKNNQSAEDIGKLWGQFYANDSLNKIPNQINQNVYSIYTDYESDYTGDYTTIIGVAVNSLENIPDGLIGRTFPNENFKVIKAKGEMPKAVINAWLDIWQHDAELQRKYTYDFEVYGEKSQNGVDSEVEIYLAVSYDI